MGKASCSTWIVVGAMIGLLAKDVRAGDLKITLPKRSEYTPVQRLNRQGVDAVRKHEYEKAKALFYKAYLYDPDDPFTLNNLGYVAELDGQLERAQRFYSLASQQNTEAMIDAASTREARGKSFRDEITGIRDLAVQVNRANVRAVELLSDGRATEADRMLQGALALDPRNPFTLNNMGVAKEMEGELMQSLTYYNSAAALHSEEPVMVTLSNSWRGKPVSRMASESAKVVLQRLHHPGSSEANAAEYNLRGVSAINRNDWRDAEQYFRQAYSLDPSNAFSLNNMGYVSEMNGDSETAQIFYERARSAAGAGTRVGVATDASAKGLRIFQVSEDNDSKVDQRLAQQAEIKRRQGGPIQLRRRDGTPVTGPAPVPPADSEPAVPRPPVPRPPGQVDQNNNPPQ
ncbi:MAG: tetratricopeptide repeat protein [Acidobacteria bacterium]|nr:tetratricopeptide repeat protein [Acidobacteriota bacterium]